MIAIAQAILLGIVQGLTEFIPISSSAHLIIVPWLLKPITGLEDFGLAFDLALHLGTLVAVLGYFWSDWLRYIHAFLDSLRERAVAGHHDRLLAWLIILGSVPGGLAGALLDTAIEDFFHAPNVSHQPLAMVVIALFMAMLGVLLWAADAHCRHTRALTSLSVRDALLIGLAQALAVLPGVSRSGSTITMGLALGLQRESAARFSFLLAAPIIAGAGTLKLWQAWHSGVLAANTAIFVAGFVAAAVVGYLCIAYLLRYLQNNSLLVFAVYRLVAAMGIVALVVAGFGR